MSDIRDIKKQGIFSGIRNKMLFFFIPLFIITLTSIELFKIYGIPFTSVAGEYKTERSNVFKGLNLVADLKKERLLRWLKNIHDDSIVIGESDFVKSNIVKIYALRENYLKSDEAVDARDRDIGLLIENNIAYRTLKKHLAFVKRNYGLYKSIEITDAKTGRIIVADNHRTIGVEIIGSDLLSEIATYNNYFLNVGYDSDKKSLELTTYYPIHIENRIIAVLVMHINTEDFIEPLLHTGEGLGTTGEALLVNSEVKILTPLKHNLPDGGRAEPLKFRIKAKPAEFAAQGREGIIETKDYRGESVLAAYRHLRILPGTGWGMVVKRDTSEVFAPYKNKLIHSMFITIIGAFIVAIAIMIFVRRLSGPIIHLSKTAQRVEEGDLTVRASENASDEVGFLAKTFNSMVQRIQDRHKELLKANKRLQNEIDSHKESEERFRRLSEATFEGIVITDKGTIVDSNRQFAEIFGYETKELIGMTATDLVTAEHRDMAKDRIISGYEKPYETVCLKKDGTKIFIDVSGKTIDISGSKMRITAARDITDWKKNEERIIRQRNTLEAINKIFEKTLICETEEELGRTSLEVLEALTDSRFGFIGEINSSGLFDTIAISNPGMDECKLPEGKATLVIKNMPIRGVDRATMRDGASRIVNGEDDIHSHPDHVKIPKGHPPVKCFLGVPLKHEGRTIGMIGLGNKEGGYDLNDQEAVERVSTAIVQALKNKRTDQQLLWESRVNEIMAKLSSSIVQSTSVDEISDIVCDYAKEITNSKYSWTGYIDSSTGYLVATSISRDVWEKCQVTDKSLIFKEFTGIWGWVLNNKKPLLTNSPQEDTRYKGTPEGHVDVDRFLSVPAVMGETLVGQITIINSTRDYNEQDMKILERMATLYAIAIQRSRSNKQISDSLKEKDLLLGEIHHRVKNNLAIVSSMLSMQRNFITDRKHLDLFKESENRIKSMALIHEKLYKSDDLARINFKDYINTLSNDLLNTYRTEDSGAIDLQLDVTDIYLGIDMAVPCGLLINELITNTLKHAFPNGREGDMYIGMRRLQDKRIELQIKDNGVGIPDDIDIRNTETLGMQLIVGVAESQLNGELLLQRSGGTIITVSFMERERKNQ